MRGKIYQELVGRILVLTGIVWNLSFFVVFGCFRRGNIGNNLILESEGGVYF